jgi:hypothetical protein
MIKLISVLIFALAGSTLPVAAEVVLRGIPSERIVANPSGASQLQLSDVDALAALVTIDREGDRYFWSSRDGSELVRRFSGIYTIFIAQSGAGYIKVERPLYDGQPFHFMEHIHLGLSTITYFGETKVFND